MNTCEHANFDDYFDRCEDCGYEMNSQDTIEAIKGNEVYQQVIKDSFGGVLYNVANRNKYDSAQIIAMWESMTPAERSSAGGIMLGAFNFLRGE